MGNNEDKFIKDACKEYIKDKQKPAVINPVRVKNLLDAYDIIKKNIRGKNVKATYCLHEPFSEVGSITITGKNLEFISVAWFLKACELATNVEILPKTTKEVEINLTFYGLTRKI